MELEKFEEQADKYFELSKVYSEMSEIFPEVSKEFSKISELCLWMHDKNLSLVEQFEDCYPDEYFENEMDKIFKLAEIYLKISEIEHLSYKVYFEIGKKVWSFVNSAGQQTNEVQEGTIRNIPIKTYIDALMLSTNFGTALLEMAQKRQKELLSELKG